MLDIAVYVFDVNTSRTTKDDEIYSYVSLREEFSCSNKPPIACVDVQGNAGPWSQESE